MSMSRNEEEISSSDEENDQMLREALDPHMFSVGGAAAAGYRETERRADHSRENILNVTPEFQNFVAKRLSDLLDRTIKERRHKDCGFIPDLSTGIRLFSESKRVLIDNKFADPCLDCETRSEDAVTRNRKRRRKSRPLKNGENEVDELEKVRLASVSAEWILHGECIKGWSKPKGKVFAYRRNKNGVLETEDPP